MPAQQHQNHSHPGKEATRSCSDSLQSLQGSLVNDTLNLERLNRRFGELQHQRWDELDDAIRMLAGSHSLKEALPSYEKASRLFGLAIREVVDAIEGVPSDHRAGVIEYADRALSYWRQCTDFFSAEARRLKEEELSLKKEAQLAAAPERVKSCLGSALPLLEPARADAIAAAAHAALQGVSSRRPFETLLKKLPLTVAEHIRLLYSEMRGECDVLAKEGAQSLTLLNQQLEFSARGQLQCERKLHEQRCRLANGKPQQGAPSVPAEPVIHGRQRTPSGELLFGEDANGFFVRLIKKRFFSSRAALVTCRLGHFSSGVAAAQLHFQEIKQNLSALRAFDLLGRLKEARLYSILTAHGRIEELANIDHKPGINLTGADFRGTIFRNVKTERASLAAADLSQATFDAETTFSNCLAQGGRSDNAVTLADAAGPVPPGIRERAGGFISRLMENAAALAGRLGWKPADAAAMEPVTNFDGIRAIELAAQSAFLKERFMVKETNLPRGAKGLQVAFDGGLVEMQTEPGHPAKVLVRVFQQIGDSLQLIDDPEVTFEGEAAAGLQYLNEICRINPMPAEFGNSVAEKAAPVIWPPTLAAKKLTSRIRRLRGFKEELTLRPAVS